MPVWLFPLLCFSAVVLGVVVLFVVGVFVWFMGMVRVLAGCEVEDDSVDD